MKKIRELRADEIEVRVGVVRKNGISLLLYKDARCDMNILDDRTPQKRLCSWVKKYKKFGEDYFTDKNKYSYKATSKTKTVFLSKTFNDPKFIALVIEKKDNGTLDYRVIRKLEDEKTNN